MITYYAGDKQYEICPFAIWTEDIFVIARALREGAMSDCEGMKEACWENVHEGAEWEPVADGFMKSINERLRVHDILIKQKADAEEGSEEAKTLAELEGSATVRAYMENIIEELKSATRERGRRDDIHIVK
jgi:hypothetical protein